MTMLAQHPPRLGQWPSVMRASGLLLLSWFLFIHHLGANSLWFDEAFGYHQLQRAVSELILQPACCHPPLHFVLMRGWLLLAGASEFSLRFLPAALGLLAAAGTYRLGRAVGNERVGLLALLLFGTASRIEFHVRELTPYGLMLASATLLGLSLLAFARAPTRRAGLGLLLATLVALMTHYGELILLVSLNVAVGWVVLRSRPWHAALRWGAQALAYQLPGLALFAFIYQRATAQQMAQQMALHPPTPEAYLTWRTFAEQTTNFWQYLFAGYQPLNFAHGVWGALAMVGFAYLLWRKRTAWLALTVFMGLGLSYGLAAYGRYVYGYRHILFVAPYVMVAVAVGADVLLNTFRRWQMSPIVGYAVLGLGLLGTISQWPAPLLNNDQTEQENLRPVLECLAEHYQTGEQVYVYYGAWPAFAYYNRDARWTAVKGMWFRGQPLAQQLAEVEAAFAQQRGWIVFAHIYLDEDRQLLAGLEAQTPRLYTCAALRASAVLFEARAPSP